MADLTVEERIWVVASRQRVWQAITEPQELEQWYAPGCPWELPALRVGETVKFHNSETDVLEATIQALEPLRVFTLSWHPEPAYPAVSLLNTYLLEEEGEGTRVLISQSGYESLPSGVRQERMREDTGAFAAIAESLKVHLEKPAEAS